MGNLLCVCAMPPRKRAKPEAESAVNWAESDSDEPSSSIEEEDDLASSSDEEATEPKGQQDQAHSATSDENPYLLTKHEGPFADDRTVFVGQIPKDTRAPALRGLFTRSGAISRISIMKFKDTGRPMGSAFVEFMEPEGAQQALARNGESYKGRLLRINMAGRKPAKSSKPDVPGTSTRDLDQRLVYVGNLNFKTEKGGLIQFFKHCGKILNIDLPLWRDSGKKRGFAMVEFVEPKSVAAALKLNGKDLDGRSVVVALRSDNRGTKPAAGQKRKRKESRTQTE